MRILNHIRSLYRGLVPEPVRRGLRRVLAPERLYASGFFSDMEEAQKESYGLMAGSLVRELAPSSWFDAGCGTGSFLLALQMAGAGRCSGIEFHSAGLRQCKRRKVDATFGDLTQYRELDAAISVVSCMEVAEHLPDSAADTLVRSLTSGPDTIVFSAATPGQGGHDHINEQPHEYWLEKFAKHRFNPDSELTSSLRTEWTAGGVVHWYARNLFVLRRAPHV